ncbi:hypothetical protein HALLA_06735 [Halostagnicola larsenii XH-48]|uniref:Uncharacterized protein n=1 Tax=Halostagnicola larsenii XH-48 TaxID=797299 RepID=W0JIM8_9EURY|nr:hypothetical protein [Halostagnicola larsenii]AHF98590.1 hypothetical protein HALLA_06735 [Halostagnicola larsenii XH-48]
MSLESSAAVTASIVPFDLTIGVTALASVALALFVGVMLLLTFTLTPPSAESSTQSATQSSAAAETAESTD